MDFMTANMRSTIIIMRIEALMTANMRSTMIINAMTFN